EYRAKLTPCPSQVAPNGWGDPGSVFMLAEARSAKRVPVVKARASWFARVLGGNFLQDVAKCRGESNHHYWAI
ncbi:MAG TPA: hypothetical protein VJN18_31645, partial [Polyangiaceae bacterium]|nr:hypothetical protein [Polyangiaceae bacterium]